MCRHNISVQLRNERATLQCSTPANPTNFLRVGVLHHCGLQPPSKQPLLSRGLCSTLVSCAASTQPAALFSLLVDTWLSWTPCYLASTPPSEPSSIIDGHLAILDAMCPCINTARCPFRHCRWTLAAETHEQRKEWLDVLVPLFHRSQPGRVTAAGAGAGAGAAGPTLESRSSAGSSGAAGSAAAGGGMGGAAGTAAGGQGRGGGGRGGAGAGTGAGSVSGGELRAESSSRSAASSQPEGSRGGVRGMPPPAPSRSGVSVCGRALRSKRGAFGKVRRWSV